MLDLLCDRSTVFVKELNVMRNAIVSELVHLIFFNRDISAEDIWKG